MSEQRPSGRLQPGAGSAGPGPLAPRAGPQTIPGDSLHRDGNPEPGTRRLTHPHSTGTGAREPRGRHARDAAAAVRAGLARARE